jgi:hypothetical protein
MSQATSSISHDNNTSNAACLLLLSPMSQQPLRLLA